MDFEPLYPSTTGRSGNTASCVLRVSLPGADSNLLLTGDIDSRVENELIATQGGRLASSILVAGHHGSATPTGGDFLAAVAPRFVLYAAGYANRFDFPAAAVRERVAAWGARSLDTASAGAIHFRLGTAGLKGPGGTAGNTGVCGAIAFGMRGPCTGPPNCQSRVSENYGNGLSFEPQGALYCRRPVTKSRRQRTYGRPLMDNG